MQRKTSFADDLIPDLSENTAFRSVNQTMEVDVFSRENGSWLKLLKAVCFCSFCAHLGTLHNEEGNANADGKEQQYIE